MALFCGILHSDLLLTDQFSAPPPPLGLVNCTAIPKEDVVHDLDYGQSHRCIVLVHCLLTPPFYCILHECTEYGVQIMYAMNFAAQSTL